MKLSELAQQYNLATEPLQEVCEVLKIKLPKGLDSEVREADAARVLSFDGLETVEGEAFKPIIAKEFAEKHKRATAAKKGAETRKKKIQEDAEAKRREDEIRIGEERRKHEQQLIRQRTEEEARAAAAAAKLKAEEQALAQRMAEEEARHSAEEDLRRRESESRRMSSEFAAMRGAQHAAAAGTGAPPTATATVEAPADPVQDAEPPGEAPVDQPQALAPGVPGAPGSPAAPSAPATVTAPMAPAITVSVPEALKKSLGGIGSRLASMAKATHEKADHSSKAIPKPAAGASGAPVSEEALTPEDRRRLIQANIARNLQMAKKVAEAKAAKRPGFRPIDRTKTPGGPNRGPVGRGPGGPGGRPAPGAKGPGGRGRDSRGHRTDAEIKEEAEGKANRRWKSSLDEDISGVTEFSVSLPCTVREFSEASGVKTSIIIAKLLMLGMMVNVNSVLEKDAIELLAGEFKKTVTIVEATDVAEQIEAEHADALAEDKPEDLAPRPPVVTIMGHVDHGKTSLLDAIRASDVAAGESGGITQHIGAYTVTTKSGLDVTFIDTPGHEAFTEMRARGSRITDVAVIVVAADDGVMPQTVEAINHAKAAKVSIVVALNKIDKPEAQAAGQREKIIRQLAENGLQAEEWGGDVAVIGTSARSGEGIEEMLGRLALETEVLELKANHFAVASGTVIESHRHEGQGITATFLVQRGSLAVGDVVLAGTGYGKVRSMLNWKGERVSLAGPSHAVEIIGLDEIPRAGDRFQVMESTQEAAEAAEVRRIKSRERELAAKQKTTTAATIFGDLATAKKKEIRLVVKADAAGSIEVLHKTINDLATDDVRVSIIHSGVGGVTSSDVTLAEASKAAIIGFHVIADPKARALADQHGLEIRSYTIIYELLDELRGLMTGMLDPEMRETVIGHAEVRNTFQITKVGVVAGLYITDGIVRRDAFMRITRDNTILHTGKVGSLRRFKEDVKEVKTGFECGLTIENFENIKVGDIMEFYSKEKVARKL